MASHFLRFGHVPPFHQGPLGVIPSMVGLQWIFGGYRALSDKQSGCRDAITGKPLDISIG